MYSAEYFIKSLGLEKHVEGGYFKQSFVSGENITSNDLRTKFEGEGELTTHELGLSIANGEVPQVLVPKNYIFGSAMNHEGFSLVGCMVSPGFEFRDFELFEREYLLGLYPEHEEVILKLTRE